MSADVLTGFGEAINETNASFFNFCRLYYVLNITQEKEIKGSEVGRTGWLVISQTVIMAGT
jgi:hypothetical protein